jgi:hypothetical protein
MMNNEMEKQFANLAAAQARLTIVIADSNQKLDQLALDQAAHTVTNILFRLPFRIEWINLHIIRPFRM